MDQVWVSAWMWGYAKTQTRNHIITTLCPMPLPFVILSCVVVGGGAFVEWMASLCSYGVSVLVSCCRRGGGLGAVAASDPDCTRMIVD